jgi:hypothetical protein
MDDASVIATIATVKADLTWAQKHERLLLVALVAVALWFGIGKIDTLIANHDNANLHQAQVIADQQAAVNAGLAQQAAYQAEQYKALAAQVTAQAVALEQANVNLANALIKQQHTDATLQPTELVQRLNTLVPNAASTVTPTGVAIPQAGAVAVVQQLEAVPVLRTQLENERTQLGDAQKLVTGEGQQIATLNTLVTGKDALLKDADNVCTEKIKTVKDAAAKSKRRWFLIGVGVGFAARQYIKTTLGF